MASEEADHKAVPAGSAARTLLTQSFLTSLPIVLTVGLGFAANYAQSRQQHEDELRTLAAQAELDRKSRQDDADRAYRLQEREADAKLDQQAREFAANAELASGRFTQEQLTLRTQHAAQQAQQAREFDQSLERQRRQNETDLLLEAIKVGDLAVARSNIEFLIQAGIVRDADGRIALAARQQPPVLPTASGALEVRVPTSQSDEGRALVTELAQTLPPGRSPAGVLEGRLASLIDAISRERERYSVRELAAMLAIIEYETNGTFQPSQDRCSRRMLEILGVSDIPEALDDAGCFELAYGAATPRGRRLGNTAPGDGYRYRGRGYVLLTGKANYARIGREWGADYVSRPELLDQPGHAFRSVLTLSANGLRSLRDHPDFGAADTTAFPFAEAMRPLLRSITGNAPADRLAVLARRAAEIEAALRRSLG